MTTGEFENLMRLLNSKNEGFIGLGLQICTGMEWDFAFNLTTKDFANFVTSSIKNHYVNEIGNYVLFLAFIKKMRFGIVSEKEWAYYRLKTEYVKTERFYYDCAPSFSMPDETTVFDNFAKNFLFGLSFGADSINIRFSYSLNNKEKTHCKNPVDYATNILKVPKLLKLTLNPLSAVLFNPNNRAILSKKTL